MHICITQKQSDTYCVSPVTMYQKIVTNNFVTFICNNIQHKQNIYMTCESSSIKLNYEILSRILLTDKP
jgi:hypothetical protein